MQRRKNPEQKRRNETGRVKKSFCCQARFRSVKNAADAKLEKTSLTTDVFIGPCNRNLFSPCRFRSGALAVFRTGSVCFIIYDFIEQFRQFLIHFLIGELTGSDCLMAAAAVF